MTKHLEKPSRKPARGRAKRRPKGSGWSPERRARQAELIRASKPWKKSTGPRTDAGKALSAANALKHGFRSCAFIERVREERRLIRLAAQTIALAKLVLGPRGACPRAAPRADPGARTRGALLRILSAKRAREDEAATQPEADTRPVPTNVDTRTP